MSIFEIIDPVGELYPKAFVEAIPIVEAILSKQEFLDILVDLYPKMNVGCASGVLSTEGKFKVDTIQLKADCDAYACVYVGVPGRDSDYFTIYFNPLLLLRAKRLEDSAKHSASDTVSLTGKRPASPIVAAQSKKSRTKAAGFGTEAVPVPVADEVDVRLTMFFCHQTHP